MKDKLLHTSKLMGPIKCSECGRETSDQAVACPGCGAPLSAAPSPSGIPQPRSEDVYLVLIEGQECGPYTIGELQSLFVDGKIGPETPFTRYGSDNWAPLEAIYQRILDYEEAPSLGASGEDSSGQLSDGTRDQTIVVRPVAETPPIVPQGETPAQFAKLPAAAPRSVRERKASKKQKDYLRGLGVGDENLLASLGMSAASELIEQRKKISGRMREIIYGLQRSCNLRSTIPKDILSQLLAFDESTIPNEPALLAYIQKHHPKLLLSESYARKKAGQERQMREIMRRGEFAPTVEITKMPPRDPSEADASLAQKRFLRDLGVREETLLARLGTYQASELINKILEARDAQNEP